MEHFSRLKEYLYKRHEFDAHVNLLQIKIARIEEGSAELTMPVLQDIHSNLFKVAHGGALASLADTAMGLACATAGKKVVTLEMNMNFIRGAIAQEAIYAKGNLLHNGNRTMVAEAEVVDGMNKVLLKARGTFFIVDTFLTDELYRKIIFAQSNS